MARTIEPSSDYVVPLGKGKLIQSATDQSHAITVISYGMGVHWAFQAAKQFPGQVEIVDLRSLYPLDMELIVKSVEKHHRVMVVTEEPPSNGFGQALAGKIQEECFEYLDAPVMTVGSEELPAIPLNETLEQTMILSSEKVADAMSRLLGY